MALQDLNQILGCSSPILFIYTFYSLIRGLKRKHPHKLREGRRELFSPRAPGKRMMLWLSIAAAIPGWKQLPRGTSRLGAATWAALCPQSAGLWWSSLEKNRELCLKGRCLPWRIGVRQLLLPLSTSSLLKAESVFSRLKIYFASPQTPVKLSGFWKCFLQVHTWAEELLE